MQVSTSDRAPFKRALIIAIVLASSFGAVNMVSASERQCYGIDDICLWGNNNYRWLIFRQGENSGNYELVGDANNEMDSWKNRSEDYDSSGYGNRNFTGDCQEFGKNKKDNNVAFWNSDEVSSVRTGTDC